MTIQTRLTLVKSILVSLFLGNSFAYAEPDFMVPNLTIDKPVQQVVGVIYPKQRFLLSLATSGIVDKVYVDESDFIDSGELLIRLEQGVQQKELERVRFLQDDMRLIKVVKERLVLQEKQLASALKLYELSRSVSLDEVNALRMNVLNSQAELIRLELDKYEEKNQYESIKLQLEQRSLTSPTSGYVAKITLKEGEWAQAGEPIMEVVNVSHSYIRINLSHQQADKLTLNQQLNVQIEDYLTQGKVDFISPVADPASGQVEVKVEVENPSLIFRPGLKATIYLN